MTHWATTSDDVLLRAARKDPEAFAAFYRRHVQTVARFLLSRARDRELAMDLTAEVFAAALLTAKRYRASRGSAPAWLLAIAQHKLVDAQRRNGAEDRARRRLGMERLALSDEELDRVVEQLSLPAGTPSLVERLRELPRDQREAVTARVIHEQSYSCISLATGVAEGTLRQRVRRGLRQLSGTAMEEHK